jgi:cellulose synthase/poly-beta-1,6-N-acetylglucosamine synthase-like glycosyltransferase
MIHPLFQLLSLLLFLYLLSNSAYILVFAIAGRFLKAKSFSSNANWKQMVILIPSFREDHIIVDSAARASAHNYPKSHFSVLVIADKLQPETLDRLRKIPVEVVVVDENMKSRSIHQALKSLPDGKFEVVVILDADNIMEEGCLEKVNDAFQHGYRAVQCHRTAKNKNTPVALLDAISEEININLFRRGPSVLELSAAPIGSGMAFEFGLLKEIFSSAEILQNPGEDREIDIELMKRKVKMEFIDDAYVLDEKVSSAAVFEKQRTRWLEAQINHVRRFFHPDMKNAPRTFLYYNKLIQNLLLPRILFLLLFGVIVLVLSAQEIFHAVLLYPPAAWWTSCLVIYLLSLLVSIPPSYYNMRTVKALFYVPVLMLSMLRALLKVKKKRKEFLHTPKSYTSE